MSEKAKSKKFKIRKELTFYYGPTEKYGVLVHRKDKFVGLAEIIHKKYPKVHIGFKQTNLINRLSVELNGYGVFECNTLHMRYDGVDYTSLIGYKTIDDVLKRIYFIEKNKKDLDADDKVPLYWTQSFGDDTFGFDL